MIKFFNKNKKVIHAPAVVTVEPAEPISYEQWVKEFNVSGKYQRDIETELRILELEEEIRQKQIEIKQTIIHGAHKYTCTTQIES